MFFRYLRRELRRRVRSAAVVTVGLALGVALVITITAAASGVTTAEGQVLQSLYGVGTDITVTTAPTPGTGGGGFRFGGFGGSTAGGAQPGSTVNEDHLSSASGLATMDSGRVSSISGLRGVAGATGALLLNATHISGTVPDFGGSGSSGSGSSGSGSSNPLTISSYSVTGVDPADPGVGPLSAGNITSGTAVVKDWFSQTSQSGSSNQHLALVTSSYAKQHSIAAGSTFSIATSTTSSTKFTVLGVISVGQSDAADVYIPLSAAQSLAGDSGKVNTIFVTAAGSGDISAVAGEIQKLMPSATVTTAQNLASQVSGSLSTASTLAKTLGLWLAGAVLLAAVLLAVLLTISSVTRRVREFGTLKAIGWRSRRIVGQVIGESVVLGVIGGLLGTGLGVLGAVLVAKLLPTVQATVNPITAAFTRPSQFSGGFPGGFASFTPNPSFAARSGGFARTFANPSHTVNVHLGAPISVEILLIAIGLAILGGLVAGVLGGWRAARLRPAAALRRVE